MLKSEDVTLNITSSSAGGTPHKGIFSTNISLSLKYMIGDHHIMKRLQWSENTRMPYSQAPVKKLVINQID